MKNLRVRRSTSFLSSKKLLPYVLLSVCVVILVLVVGTLLLSRFHSPSYISPIPILSGNKNVHASAKEDEIKQLLKKERMPYTSITVESNIIRVVLSGGEEVIFAKEKSSTQQVSSLQLLYSRLTIEGKQIEKIDLRFDRPVITFR